MRDWMKKARKDAGLTLKEVGVRLGISESYYAQIESGNRSKSLDITMAAKLAEIFGLSIDTIINYEKEGK